MCITSIRAEFSPQHVRAKSKQLGAHNTLAALNINKNWG
jgi:hypothetical protein